MSALAVLPIVSFAQVESVSVKAKIGTTTEARLKAKTEYELRKKELEERKEELKNQFEAKKTEIEQRREEIKDQIEVRKTEMEQKREEVKNKIEEKKEAALIKIQERLNKFVTNIKERFTAAIERLETLASRIDSRIVKMEAENIDVTKAKELMAVAKIKIETAKTSIAGIDLESQVIVSSAATTTAAFKGDFQILKNQVGQAKKDIKAAHAALVDVVNNLKPGYNKAKSTTTATSTANTSPDNN